MNLKNKKKKQEICAIKTIEEYNNYMDSLKITEEQRQIMDYIFIKGYEYAFIADLLGYSERTIKQKVKKIFDFL